MSKAGETAKYGVVKDSMPIWWETPYDTLEEAQKKAVEKSNEDGRAYIVIKTVGIARPTLLPSEYQILGDLDVK